MRVIYQDGVPMPQRIWAVIAISVGVIMSTLDGAIANVALPSIAHDVGASAAASVWVVNAYQLTVTITLLPTAVLGEILGFRRVFLAGFIIFTLASLGCGLSHSLPQLILARILQGAGAAGLMSLYPALLRIIYPRTILGAGIGISATIVALSSALGPSVAAAILSIAHWEWLFIVNVPIGMIGVAMGVWALPATAILRHRFDFLGAALSAVVLGLLIIGIDGTGRPDGRLLALTEIMLGLVLGVILLRMQRGRSAPMVPADLLGIPLFLLSVCTSVCSYAAQILCLVSLPFYFEDVLGRSAVQTGLLMTPLPLAVAIVAQAAGRLADRYPAGILCGIGLLAMAGGLISLAAMPQDAAIWNIVWREMLVGLGFAFFQTPNNRAILTIAPPSRAGAAGGMLATARLFGQSLGASLVAVIFEMSAPHHGTRPALVVATLIALAGAVASFLRLRQGIEAA